MQRISNLYDQSVNLIISPPKIQYFNNDVPNQETVKNQKSKQIPFKFVNNRKQKINCYFYKPNSPNFEKCEFKYTLIYLHSNGSNCLEGLFLTRVCCYYQIGLVLFDWAGCGKSSGNFITYGINEAEDLEILVDYLKDNFDINRFSFWGRSLGAVSALFYSEKHPLGLQSMVLDSPFFKLKSAISNYASNKLGLLPIFTNIALKILSSKIKAKAKHDIFDMCLKDQIKAVNCKTVLIASKNDEMVKYKDFEKMYKLFDKNIIQMVMTNKSHGQQREAEVLAQSFYTMLEHLRPDQSVDYDEILLVFNRQDILLKEKQDVQVNVFEPEPIFRKKTNMLSMPEIAPIFPVKQEQLSASYNLLRLGSVSRQSRMKRSRHYSKSPVPQKRMQQNKSQNLNKKCHKIFDDIL